MLFQADAGSGWILLHGLDTASAEAYRPALKTALLQPREGGMDVLDEASGLVLTYPPQNVIAIVHAGEAPAELLRWRDEAGIDAPLVAHMPDTPSALAAVSRRLARAAGRNAELILRLAELRAVHEEVQNSYNALRNYVCENSLVPPRLGFINQPDTDSSAVLPESVSEVLQPLPVDSRSLCGVSLYLAAQTPSSAEGRLLVDLVAAEDDDIRLSWRASYKELTQGWVTFAFEQNERFWRKSPVLRLRFETVTGPVPLFGMAKPQLRQDMAARVNGQLGSRPLALQVWQSVPGAPLNVSSQMWPVVLMDRKPVSQIELTIDETLAVADILNQAAQDGFQRITLLPARKRIQVHPVEGQISVACLFETCPPGTSRVVVEMETDSPNAGQVEYAIAVLSPEQTQLAGRLGKLPEDIAASDWVELPPAVTGSVALSLPETLQSPGDLYLMTRLLQGQSSAYGWAQFLRVSFQGTF